jgi:hypothetical protein
MAQVQPQQFFRFAGEHCDLLLELYRHCERQSISEARLLQVIRRFTTPDSPSSRYLVERLLQMGFLELPPDTDMAYEMPHAIGKLLGFLLQEYRLTSVEVIQGYLKALDRFCNELEQASIQHNGDAVARLIYEVDEHVERMRSDSLSNRYKIIDECEKAKVNRDKLSVRQRFELINDLYSKYLMPLRDMIDVSKEMDTQLERLQRSLAVGKNRFETKRHVRQLYDRASARLVRLKRDIDKDFRQSYLELRPLYERCRRETLIAQGASAALREIARTGIKKFDTSRYTGFAAFRTQGLMADIELEAYLYGIIHYEPKAVRIEPDRPTDAPPEFTGLSDLRQHLAGIDRIDDVLQWILEIFANEALSGQLRIYGMFHSEHLGRLDFSDQRRSYQSHSITLKAYPMQWIKETSHV